MSFDAPACLELIGQKLSQSDHCEASYGRKNEIIGAFLTF